MLFLMEEFKLLNIERIVEIKHHHCNKRHSKYFCS